MRGRSERKSNKLRAFRYANYPGFLYDFASFTMGSRKKILIAEDYADIRTMTRIMVEAIGFDVIEASDGAEAIEQARKNKPDAVLMDIAMPVLERHNGGDDDPSDRRSGGCTDHSRHRLWPGLSKGRGRLRLRRDHPETCRY